MILNLRAGFYDQSKYDRNLYSVLSVISFLCEGSAMFVLEGRSVISSHLYLIIWHCYPKRPLTLQFVDNWFTNWFTNWSTASPSKMNQMSGINKKCTFLHMTNCTGRGGGPQCKGIYYITDRSIKILKNNRSMQELSKSSKARSISIKDDDSQKHSLCNHKFV